MTDQAATDTDYKKKVEQQLQQYAEGFDLHQLPPAYFHWAHYFLRPGLTEVYGQVDLNDFYATPFIEGARKSARPRFLSVGCGDGANEIALAQRLVERGLTDFEFVCADLSAPLLERFETSIEPIMRRLFTLMEVDLNNMGAAVSGGFDGVMASHSLHHLVELERVFDWIKEVLRPGCVFAINDMIGRNGHMRWPESAAFIQMLWPILDDRQRYHAQLKHLYEEFEDLDCSSSGFEGVRAQDILPLLAQRFHPHRFFAGGGLIDPFIDRGFGYGFDLSLEKDRSMLEFIAKLNDALLDNGQITPTLMLAHFYNEPGEEKFYRSRSARTCIRDPEKNPAWTANFPEVKVIRS